MENQSTIKRKKIIIILVVIFLVIFLGIIVWSTINNNFITILNRNVDERYIDDSDSTGEGIKIIFIDAVTGKRIKNEKVTVDVFNGMMCLTGNCDSYDIFTEEKIDKNGVAFIDFSQWPKKTNGHIILNWLGL